MGEVVRACCATVEEIRFHGVYGVAGGNPQDVSLYMACFRAATNLRVLVLSRVDMRDPEFNMFMCWLCSDGSRNLEEIDFSGNVNIYDVRTVGSMLAINKTLTTLNLDGIGPIDCAEEAAILAHGISENKTLVRFHLPVIISVLDPHVPQILVQLGKHPALKYISLEGKYLLKDESSCAGICSMLGESSTLEHLRIRCPLPEHEDFCDLAFAELSGDRGSVAASRLKILDLDSNQCDGTVASGTVAHVLASNNFLESLGFSNSTWDDLEKGLDFRPWSVWSGPCVNTALQHMRIYARGRDVQRGYAKNQISGFESIRDNLLGLRYLDLSSCMAQLEDGSYEAILQKTSLEVLKVGLVYDTKILWDIMGKSASLKHVEIAVGPLSERHGTER